MEADGLKEMADRPGDQCMEAVWRHCLLATLQDMRAARQRGRPMTRPNAERLFSRRWWKEAERIPSVNTDQIQKLVLEGRRLIRSCKT
jgi:hypothetical protein